VASQPVASALAEDVSALGPTSSSPQCRAREKKYVLYPVKGKPIEGTKYKNVIKLTLRNKKRRSSAKNDRGLVNSDHDAAFYDVKHLQKVKANYKSEFSVGNYLKLLSRCSLECQSYFRFLKYPSLC